MVWTGLEADWERGGGQRRAVVVMVRPELSAKGECRQEGRAEPSGSCGEEPLGSSEGVEHHMALNHLT